MSAQSRIGLQAHTAQTASYLIHLFRYSDVVLDAFLRLAGCEQAIGAKGLVTLRDALAEALTQIDLRISERSHPL
jgi:hypothetical protein